MPLAAAEFRSCWAWMAWAALNMAAGVGSTPAPMPMGICGTDATVPGICAMLAGVTWAAAACCTWACAWAAAFAAAATAAAAADSAAAFSALAALLLLRRPAPTGTLRSVPPAVQYL